MRNDLGGKFSKKVYRSILLHELVHHMQNENKTDFMCRGKKEEEAYKLQDKWLIENGEKGIMESLKLNDLYMIMLFTCTEGMWGWAFPTEPQSTYRRFE